jgi:hypothetical protein
MRSGRVGKTSRYAGVTLFTAAQRYAAFVIVARKRIHLGMWSNEEEAALARDRAALHHRLDVPLHFPAKARALGPATAEELRRLARVTRKVRQNASEYAGVHWNDRRERWAALICVGKKRVVQIAQFDDEREAAEAYDRVARFRGLDRSLLNFPDRLLAPASVADMRREARRTWKTRTTSRFRGVCWIRKTGLFVAQIHPGRRNIHLGNFASEEEAAHAYDRAALKFFGDAAQLNFPSAQAAASRTKARGRNDSSRRSGRSRTS